MMKRIAALLLCMTLALALCACGGAAESTVSEKPANMESTLPELTKEEEPEETEAPAVEEENPVEQAVQKALKLKERPVSELYEAIGEPNSEESSPSCLGQGEDVTLYYDGFSVFTYKEGSSHVVKDVLIEEAEETEDAAAEEELAAEQAVQKVRELTDHPVAELYEAIGEPESEESSPSCMGPGEDVTLHYDGFSVFTYKEGDSHVVKDAWVEK